MPAPSAARHTSPFAWLADEHFGVWLTRLFWFLLIVETFLWTSIGRLFTHGEVIAPVLFTTSKAALLVGVAHGIARILPKGSARADMRRDAAPVVSAMFLVWFMESLTHAISVLLVWAFNAVAPALQWPTSNSWDVFDLLLRESETFIFEQPTFVYLLLTNSVYGLLAIIVLRFLTRRWPPKRGSSETELSSLPHWSLLLAAYVLAATLHGYIMRIWVS